MKEFVINVSPEIVVKGHAYFKKVYVRGKCVRFSAVVINKYLGTGTHAEEEEEISLNKVVQEISAGQVRKWLQKGKLSTSKLTIKYAILYRIGSANWSPTNHTSSVSTVLTCLIYAVGTKAKMDFGAYIIE